MKSQVNSIHIRIFKRSGSHEGIVYDSSGKPLNGSQVVALTYGSKNWYNYLKKVHVNQIVDCKVEQCFDKQDNKIDTPVNIVDEIGVSVHGDRYISKEITPKKEEVKEPDDSVEKPKRTRRTKEEMNRDQNKS